MSGFMDGALYQSGQDCSVAALLRQQFERTGLQIPFEQPDIRTDAGYNVFYQSGIGITGRYIYHYPNPFATDPIISTLNGVELTDYAGEVGTLTNLAVPFLKTIEAGNESYAAANPYIQRLGLPAGTTLASLAADRGSRFFTLWLGMGDIYNYVRMGGTGNPSPDAASIAEYDLTPLAVFQEQMNLLVDQLLADPLSKGAIANIPDLNDLAFCFYHPYNFMRLTNGQLATSRIEYVNEFNAAVAIHNVIPDAERRPYISWDDNGLSYLSPQAMVVQDDSLCDAQYPDGRPLPKIRQVTSDEMLLMTIPMIDVSTGLGWLNPLPQEYYLNKAQIQIIRARINQMNDVIAGLVESHAGRLALVDLHSLYAQIAPVSRKDAYGNPESFDTFLFHGVPITFGLELNSVISLDGMFPNQRGSAFIANAFIRAINDAFGSEIPELDINLYVGNTVQLDK